VLRDSDGWRAIELEIAGRWREAAAAFREALPSSPVPAVLGLERVYSQAGQLDSMTAMVASLIATRPREPVFRTVQMRVLIALGRYEQAAKAFESWAADAGRDAAPYREWARLLLDAGRTAAADTVLRRAQRVLGSGRDLAMELGQLRAAMGLWAPAASSWRDAVTNASYLHEAALFALAPAPPESRAEVLRTFTAPPLVVPARRVAASLALFWNSPQEAWEALRSLPPNDSSAAAWQDFAGRAEAAGSWLVARDALVALARYRPSGEVLVRAASDALEGGDSQSGLELATSAGQMMDRAEASQRTVPIRVRALAALGRPGEAEDLLRSNSSALDSGTRARLLAVVARGWVRAGELSRARGALADAEEDEKRAVEGWLALYEGDLVAARAGLRRAEEQSPEALLALAFLARTRADRSPESGSAFLAIARGDTAVAAEKFRLAATKLSDAAPLMLAEAARLEQARGNASGAMDTWKILVERHAGSPEAMEAELEWARALRRAARTGEAIARLEHLILTYPQSALVPQARRELEEARGSVPRTP
jgi:hypothetical protein